MLASHPVGNIPQAVAALIAEIRVAEGEHGPATVGIDILGGIAALAEAMLLAEGLAVVHVPGLAVNRARRGTRGGEHKSDPKDAAVIADQVRMRDDLRVVEPARDIDIELRLLTGRRSEIVADQTRRAQRLRDLLVPVFPALERTVDVTTKTGLHLLTRYVTPAEFRRAGRARLTAHLRRAGRDQLAAIDKQIEAVLARHPDAALIRSLPGMGATLTAEFLAITGGLGRFPHGDRLAAAAGLAPVLKQSGKTRYLQRATAGDKALKRVFCQSAFIATGCDPASKAYYARKRHEGKTHHQAVLALARRRVNVLHAMLRNRTPYLPGREATAA